MVQLYCTACLLYIIEHWCWLNCIAPRYMWGLLLNRWSFEYYCTHILSKPGILLVRRRAKKDTNEILLVPSFFIPKDQRELGHHKRRQGTFQWWFSSLEPWSWHQSIGGHCLYAQSGSTCRCAQRNAGTGQSRSIRTSTLLRVVFMCSESVWMNWDRSRWRSSYRTIGLVRPFRILCTTS